MGMLDRDPFANNPNVPKPAPVVNPDDEWRTRMLAALDQLAAAVADKPIIPAPIVEVSAPDLSEVVMAVQALKGPATAEEIAEALALVLRRETPDAPSASDALTQVVDALKRLDFRLKGGGGNMMGTGGGSVEFSPKGLTQLASALTVSGTWGYASGANGTPSLPAAARVTQITAIALGAQGSFTINGGNTILLPYDSTDKASSSIDMLIQGTLTAPTIVFDSAVDGYVVQYVA